MSGLRIIRFIRRYLIKSEYFCIDKLPVGMGNSSYSSSLEKAHNKRPA